MQTVAVIFGGKSAEHDVSIVTAISSVIKPLKLTGNYQVIPIYISKTGAWYSGERLSDISLFTTGEIDTYLEKQKPLQLILDGAMTIVEPGLRPKRISVDIVFPAMHGTYGEDGSLMGVLEMIGVPYVGCGVSASAVAMDKGLSKEIAAINGVPVSKYQLCSKDDFDKDPEKQIKRVERALTYPVFIKPVHLGSSIGISKADDQEQLRNGLEVALHYDDRAIVEEEVQNLIEVTLPIIGNDRPIPALLERPLISAEDFFDFDTKYLKNGKKGGGKKGGIKGAQGYSELPAKLDKKLYDQAMQTGLDVYKALGCSGIARVDMLIDSKMDTVYFNEINPLPGDLYRHNWHSAGVSTVELVEKLIAYALERAEQKRSLSTAFSTNYLKQF